MSQAIISLLFNSCKAPGNLEGHIAQFPNRGDYPTHFLWDACFHNLALDYMHPRLSKDALLLLAKNMRPDGKMPHFLCSTWMRPEDSQPPLVGWAALRYIKLHNDTAFAREILPCLLKNNEWWTQSRATRTGLVRANSALETGWDNSPRFDASRHVIAADMNTYLWLQINAAKEIARLTNHTTKAEELSGQEKELANKMAEHLFDSETGLFYDKLVETQEFVKIIISR
ncbi:MAG: hypothetical protein HC896_15465 [Bacteroidales bacterium]|nr:hypothetical protein [Bacteroidales bacterium]